MAKTQKPQFVFDGESYDDCSKCSAREQCPAFVLNFHSWYKEHRDAGLSINEIIELAEVEVRAGEQDAKVLGNLYAIRDGRRDANEQIDESDAQQLAMLLMLRNLGLE